VKVRRIVPNIGAPDLAAGRDFYGRVLGLDLLMDNGWIATLGADAQSTVQISLLAEGGSGTPVPQLSVEVDDLDEALARVTASGAPIVYGPANEPWGVRRFFVRDPYGTLVNILEHRPG
jgi:catechol 2,3-dioxygenase-like lactoylglutathione lyase family enzyme